MTKLKSKKMSKSTFAVIIMAIVMVAMLAFGGTYAWFTATAGAAIEGGDITTGHVELAMGSKAAITKDLENDFAVPGDDLWTIDLTLDTSKANVATYVFATWTLTNTDALALEVSVAEGWTTLEEGVYYKEVPANTAKDAVTFTGAISLKGEENGNDKMDKTVSCEVSFAMTQSGNLEPAAAYELVK